MQKFNALNSILRNLITGIVRAFYADAALQPANACNAGGITVPEISLTTPDGIYVIRSLVKRYSDNAVIGAGMVLDAATARLSILAGTHFLLSPSFDPEVIQPCSRYQIVSMPGVATAAEGVRAMEVGADVVKVFPDDAFGSNYLKALHAPLPHAPLIPIADVILENMEARFACDTVAVGVGSSLTPTEASENYEKLAENAKAFKRRSDKYKQEAPFQYEN